MHIAVHAEHQKRERKRDQPTVVNTTLNKHLNLLQCMSAQVRGRCSHERASTPAALITTHEYCCSCAVTPFICSARLQSPLGCLVPVSLQGRVNAVEGGPVGHQLVYFVQGVRQVLSALATSCGADVGAMHLRGDVHPTGVEVPAVHSK
jgi:hypothetical protein